MYLKLAAEREGTFLLESAEHGRVWSRYSFVGVRSAATLTERDGEALWTGEPPQGVPTGGDPLHALRDTVALLHTERMPDLPPLTGGMVGFVAYDAVRRLERLPELAKDDLHLPDLAMMFATDLAVLDHDEGSVLLIANAVNYDGSDERVDEAWADAVARLDRMTADLARPAPALASTYDADADAALHDQPHPGGLPRGHRARQGGDPGGRGLPGRRGAALRDGDRRRARWTSTACCGGPTPAPTCTSCASTASTSSARARRRWSRSTTATRSCTPSPAPAGGARPPRRTPGWPRSCWPTRRSAPST